MVIGKKGTTFEEYYGESFMERVEKMDPKEVVKRPEVRALWEKGLFWSLSHRRGHRITRGYDFPEGDDFFDFRAAKEVVPLDEVETALLCWAADGSTGLLAADLYTHSGAAQEWFERRTFSHGGYGAHGYLLFNNDDGVFIYTPHVPTKMVEIEKQEDMEIIFQAFKEGITRIGEPVRGGVEAPFNRLEFMGNLIFQPGQVQFIPACDTIMNLLHTLSNLLNNSNPKQRTPLIDELNGKLMCAQHWVDDGYLQGIPVPWAMLELKIMSGGGELAAMMMQNMDLVAAAMGLGTYKCTNLLMPVLLGSTPAMRGLGFRFSSDKKGFMYPVGVDGQFSAPVPPNFSLDDAADTYYRLCWGPQGRCRPWVEEGDEVLDSAFSPKPRAVHRPFKDSEGFLKVLNSYPEEMPGCGPYTPESRQIIREIFQYLYDTYGRVPRTADPMWLPFVVQVQHPAVDFYDKYYKEGIISQEQREHLKVWHGLDEE